MSKPKWESYKDRILWLDKPVEVYRNLSWKMWSVRQEGKIVAHTEAIQLRDVKFVVRQKGRLKVLATRQKNVHAFIKGMYVSNMRQEYDKYGLGENETFPICAAVTYDPYKHTEFVFEDDLRPVKTADYVCMDIRTRPHVLAIWRGLRGR